MAQQQLVKEERSLGDLFSELATETSTLVRQEVALAQTELTQKATVVGKDVGFLVVGGAVGYTALFVIFGSWVVIWFDAAYFQFVRLADYHISLDCCGNRRFSCRRGRLLLNYKRVDQT